MEKTEAELVLHSVKNGNVYYLFSDRIEIKGDIEGCIELPHQDKARCFYDMYYVNDTLHVILNTYGIYDVDYILDENTTGLYRKGYTK